MKERDNNTRFFHRLANSHRRDNHISNIEVDGVLYEDEFAVRSQVVQFYQELYTETDTWHPTVDGLDFACIGEDDRLSLEKDFSKARFQNRTEPGGRTMKTRNRDENQFFKHKKPDFLLIP